MQLQESFQYLIGIFIADLKVDKGVDNKGFGVVE